MTLDLNATFPEVFDLNGDGNASTAEGKMEKFICRSAGREFSANRGTTEQETLSSFSVLTEKLVLILRRQVSILCGRAVTQ